MFRLSRGPLVAGCAALVLAAVTACSGQTATVGSGSSGGSDADPKAVSLALVPGWDEGVAATYLWKQLLEESGYQVTVQEVEIASTFAGIANKQVDLYLDAWLPSTHKTYWDRFGDQLEVLGTWYEPADLNLSVPDYVTDVNSLADLQTHAAEFGGQIVGIEAGAGMMGITRDKVMPAYGLEGFQLSESSTAAMLASLESAIAEQRPIVVTLWRPHWAFTKMPLKVLEDPEGAFGPPDKIQPIAAKGFADSHPELAGWLAKFKLTSDQLGSLELLMQDRGQGNEQQAAKEWIDQNRQLVDSWLS